MTVAPALADEWLLDYAAGGAPEPVATLVASHLALSPASRRTVAALEALGGALLEDIEPAALAPDALESAFARIDRAAPARSPARAAGGPGDGLLPAPLRRYVPGATDSLPWRRLARGAAEVDLPCSDARGFRMSLLRIAPGATMPRHTHRGAEMTLVLKGSFSDETARYARGDVAVADESVEHTPAAGREDECMCLVVQQGPIRLTGTFSRLLNPFLR